MSAAARLGLVVLTLAILLGLLADWLLRATPLGLGAVLWTLALVAALAGVAAWRGRLRGSLLLGIVLAPLFALCLLWRDSPILAELDVIALVTCLVLVAAPGGSLRRVQLDELAHGLLLWIASVAAGLAPTIRGDIPWKDVAHPGHRRRAAALGRGLALAVPVLVVFGVLFVTADAVFGSALGGVVPHVHRPVAQILSVVVWAWAAGGLLRLAGLGVAQPPEPGTAATPRLGAVEACVVLGLVDLLFLAF